MAHGVAARPLAGVKVLDLSMVFSGPLAALLLAQQGADVIKVEPPGGDTSRRVGPAKGDMSACYIAINRNKRGMVLDARVAEHLNAMKELVAWADVLVENYRPGVMARMGLGREVLQALNPRLVHLSINGYGPSGPYAHGRAYDQVIQAVSGVAAAHPDVNTGEPSVLGTTVCDKLTGLTAAQAVTAALFARERDGQGRLVEVAMLDAAIAFQWPDAMYNHLFMDEPPAFQPEMSSSLRLWKTADGHVAVSTPQADEFRAWCTALGHPTLPDEPRFATPPLRVQHFRELRALLEPVVALRQTDELVDELRHKGVPIGKVNGPQALVADAQVLHNGVLTELQQPGLGRARVPYMAACYDGERAAPERPAPRKGEHTAQVLSQVLGWAEERVQAALAARD